AVRVQPRHDRVRVALQDPAHVPGRLPRPETDLVVLQRDRVASQLADADVEGDARAHGRLLEQDRDGTAGQWGLRPRARLHPGGQVQKLGHFVGAQVVEVEEISTAESAEYVHS